MKPYASMTKDEQVAELKALQEQYAEMLSPLFAYKNTLLLRHVALPKYFLIFPTNGG